MTKFLAVVKREYLQRVRSRMFILMTVLAPVVMSFFALVPALIFSIRAGGPMTIAVIDQTGKVYNGMVRALAENEDSNPPSTAPDPTDVQNEQAKERINQLAIKNGSEVELQLVDSTSRDISAIRAELDARVQKKELNAYLLLPPDLLKGGKPEFFGRNTSDVFTKRLLQGAISRAVREERLREANIDAQIVEQLSKPVELQMIRIGATRGERDSGEGFRLVFVAGFVMYLTILLYGQVILGAIIEEKETKIAEILFSSTKPFILMMGKLVGVSLVALTQLLIWGLAFGAFGVYGVGVLAARGVPVSLPGIPATQFIYFGLFFLLGYFVYATLYALVGSMVTTAQEGGQLAMPIVLLLVVGFYLFLPVSRSPDSSFGFWVSMVPFFSPVTMMVRIVSQTPPFWEIAASLVIGFLTVTLLVWVAGRIYRVGMLMYGKKASLPEVWRWLRKA